MSQMPDYIEVPTFDEIQLGPYQRSETCGCLAFHVVNVRSHLNCDFMGSCLQVNAACIADQCIGGERVFNRLISESCPNTVANRRLAQKWLHAYIEALGYDVPEDA